MKLYRFDGVDDQFQLLPLAARRALDTLGLKLSLEGFRSLPLSERASLARAGSGATVDEALARSALQGAVPPAKPIEAIPEPSADGLPAEVVNQLGEARPLPLTLWQSLSPLDRYSLLKVCKRTNLQRIGDAYDEIVGSSAVSTHVRAEGGVHMVSVAEKEPTRREATAECWVTMSAEALRRLCDATGPKGDVLGTARLAGIMATKRTSDLIPLCHPLALQHAAVDLEPDLEASRLRVTCRVVVFARTGVEMEAMVGANIAALTIYDMLKSVDRGMHVGPSRLLYKSGGKSGTYDVESRTAS